MAKVTEKYEAMVVLSTKLSEEEMQALTQKFGDLISANAEEVSIDEWGKRRLAYPINYENEGFYILWNFVSKPGFPAELERVLKITDGVLRFLVTVA